MKSNPPHDNDDIRLMLSAAHGNVQAFSRLYRKYFPIVRSFLAKLDGRNDSLDDLVQEVFARAWEHRGRFRSDSSVRSYLFAIGRNIIRYEARQLAVSRQHLDRLRYSEQQWDTGRHKGLSGPEQDVYGKELRDVVREALGKLTPQQREAIRSRLVDLVPPSGNPGSPASAPTPKAAQQRLTRALKRLRQLMAG